MMTTNTGKGLFPGRKSRETNLVRPTDMSVVNMCEGANMRNSHKGLRMSNGPNFDPFIITSFILFGISIDWY